MKAQRFAASTLFLLVLAPAAFANSGVPMLAVVWPASWALLLPVIGVEAWVARRTVGLSVWQSVRAAALANLASTFVAIPLTWGAFTLSSLTFDEVWSPPFDDRWRPVYDAVVGAGWLVPYEEELHWMVPLAALVLLVPFFFASVVCEAFVFGKVTGLGKDSARRWSRRANLATYSGIALLVACVLAMELRSPAT
jgi:hypothetical protein